MGLAGRPPLISKMCVAFLLETSPQSPGHMGLRVDGGRVINFLTGCWSPSLRPQDLRQLGVGTKVIHPHNFINSVPIVHVGLFSSHSCMSAGVWGPFYMDLCVCGNWTAV